MLVSILLIATCSRHSMAMAPPQPRSLNPFNTSALNQQACVPDTTKFPFDAMGFLANGASGQGCSATLIAEDIVYTAGPCLVSNNVSNLVFYAGRSSCSQSTPSVSGASAIATFIPDANNLCGSQDLNDACHQRYFYGFAKLNTTYASWMATLNYTYSNGLVPGVLNTAGYQGKWHLLFFTIQRLLQCFMMKVR